MGNGAIHPSSILSIFGMVLSFFSTNRKDRYIDAFVKWASCANGITHTVGNVQA